MTKKKSISASFGMLSESLAPQSAGVPDEQNEQTNNSSSKRVGAGVIGATQRAMGDIRDERDRLKALLENGITCSEIDPDLIDPSPFSDRLPDDEDHEFLAFKLTLENDGQKTPIQVRPHPTDVTRYQVIFGHRRVRAAKELGISVVALVSDISDKELGIAQGLENSARQDLSWIERALFAHRLEAANFKPKEIKSALMIDDAEMTRMRFVCRVVPKEVIEEIGRAPKIGRPRWMAFAKFLEKDEGLLPLVRKTLSTDKVRKLPSNDRFKTAIDIQSAQGSKKKDIMSLKTRDGDPVGELRISEGNVQFSKKSEHGVRFAEFLKDEIPRLLEKFQEIPSKNS